MSTTHEVDFGSLRVVGPWSSASQHHDVRVELATYTKSGQARIAVLSEAELLSLTEQCVVALSQLQTRRARVAAVRQSSVQP